MSGDVIHRGELYWVNFGPVESQAPAKRRPALVVQSDHYNRSRLGTAVVAAISSNTALASYPGNVFLPMTASGLPKDSVVNVTALATVDRSVLVERIGALPEYLLHDVDSGLRLLLDV